MTKVLCIILSVFCLTVNVFATETIDTLLSDLNEQVDIPLSDDDVVSAEIEEEETMQIDTSNQIVTFDNSVLAYDLSNLSVYNSAWSGAILDYFTGIILKYPNNDYVIFRASNNIYYCVYGDIELTNGYFVGTGLNYVLYETSSYNNPSITRSIGDLNLLANGFIYSNLGDFASVSGHIEVMWYEIFTICVIALIAYFIISHIFNFR